MRAHIKSIFAKQEVACRSELTHLIINTVAEIHVGRAPAAAHPGALLREFPVSPQDQQIDEFPRAVLGGRQLDQVAAQVHTPHGFKTMSQALTLAA